MADKKTAVRTDGMQDVLAAISAMPEADRKISEKLHGIIMKSAPDLVPRTWYGMPAYGDGNKIVCFFRTRVKFGERYMTLGFNDTAKLDDGAMWPIYYAITELNETDEAKIASLIRKAVG